MCFLHGAGWFIWLGVLFVMDWIHSDEPAVYPWLSFPKRRNRKTFIVAFCLLLSASCSCSMTQSEETFSIQPEVGPSCWPCLKNTHFLYFLSTSDIQRSPGHTAAHRAHITRNNIPRIYIQRENSKDFPTWKMLSVIDSEERLYKKMKAHLLCSLSENVGKTQINLSGITSAALLLICWIVWIVSPRSLHLSSAPVTVMCLSLLQAQHHGITTGGVCTPCHCNSFGSKSFDCDENGQCRCQPGVTAPKCDRCARGFFNFQEGGCTRKSDPSKTKENLKINVIQINGSNNFPDSVVSCFLNIDIRHRYIIT